MKAIKNTIKQHLPTFVSTWHVKVDIHLFRIIFIGLTVVVAFVALVAVMGSLNQSSRQTVGTQASASITESCTLNPDGTAHININFVGKSAPYDLRLQFLDYGPWTADACASAYKGDHICKNAYIPSDLTIPRSESAWYRLWVDGRTDLTVENIYCGADNNTSLDLPADADLPDPAVTCTAVEGGSYNITLDWARRTVGETYDLRMDFSQSGAPAWTGNCESDNNDGNVCRRVPASQFTINSDYPVFNWWYHQVPRGMYDTGTREYFGTVDCDALSSSPTAAPTSVPVTGSPTVGAGSPTPTSDVFGTPAPTSSAARVGRCSFDTRAVTSWQVLADDGTRETGLIESITSDVGFHNYEYSRNTFRRDGERIPFDWSVDAGVTDIRLSSVPRYAAGPCAGRAGNCRFDTRSLYYDRSETLIEVITAYGKMWKYKVFPDRTEDPEDPLAGRYEAIINGEDLTNAAVFPLYNDDQGTGGPCFGKAEGECQFDTMTVYRFGDENLVIEEVTTEGKLWRYDITAPEFPSIQASFSDGGQRLADIPHYVQLDGPCATDPDTCRFDSRSVYYNTIDDDDPLNDYKEDVIIGDKLWRFTDRWEKTMSSQIQYEPPTGSWYNRPLGPCERL